MTKEQQAVIIRLRSDSYKYAAIAEAVGLSINTVKSYCRRQSMKMSGSNALKTVCLQRCKQCGAPVEHMVGKKHRKFCSDKCRQRWWNAHPEDVDRKAYYTKSCAHCGKLYTVYGRPNSKFCSRECAAQHRTKNVEAGL